jgi:hypothetical protein
MMTAATGFGLFLVVTLILLGAVVVTGKRSLRRRHLTLVVLAFVGLGLAIYYAEKLGDEYDLDSAGSIYPVHLAFAKSTVYAYLLPIITGILTIKGKCKRTTHGRVAVAVILLTVVTAVTGLWLVLAATPL